MQYSHHRGIQAYPFMTLIQSPQDPSQKRKKDLNSTHYNRLEANYLLQPRCSDSPSHIEFLNQFGEKIREIYLKTGIDERHEILYGSEFEMAVMSQSLAIILTHCPKLESLTLDEMNFVNTTKGNTMEQTESLLPSHVRNKSLKMLTIRHSNWYAASTLFPQLAMALPSLHYLVMDQCPLFNDEGRHIQKALAGCHYHHYQQQQEEEKKLPILTIDMPNIEFKNIAFNQEEKESKRCCNGPLCDTMYLKLHDQHHPAATPACYMTVTGNTCPLSVPTKTFDTWTDSIDHFSIHCKTLKSLHFNQLVAGSSPITFIHPNHIIQS